ncbi:MAG TPA: alpha/beta hydrolase [Allosphingosinicella sp.]
MALALLALPVAAAAAPAKRAAPPLAPGAHDQVVNGVRLWYRVAGRKQGIPVVFLHGGPGQGSQTFAKFAGPHLERSRRMIYLDQRGSGRSEKHWAKRYSIPLMVDDLEQLRRLWGVDRIALVGHSFGTLLALEYAARYPERVSHLVLSGAVVDFPAMLDLACARLEKVDPERYAKAVAELPKGSPRRCHIFAAGRDFINGNMYPDPAIMKLVDETDKTDGMYNTGEIFGALGKGLLDYRFERHGRLTMPLLAIQGASDFQAAVEPVRSFVAKVPGARLLEYEGRGHFMFVEDPERFARDVDAFLGGRAKP